MKLKICGLREAENVIALAEIKPDFMGFIFYEKSPRYFLNAIHPINIKTLPAEIKKVGVFVDQSTEYILSVCQEHRLDSVQLHGSETPDQCNKLKAEGLQVIKAFSVLNEDDLDATENYFSAVSAYLFDTKGAQKGGTGIRFNWEILSQRRFHKPFFLSGGIGPEHVSEIKYFQHPDLFAVDINSRFEISPGVKNIESVKTFLGELS